jgi:hypothetical protein
MSKYASLLFSPEEYHQIGPFRFPIYHDLVPGEAKGIEALGRKQSKSTFRSVKIAQRIAKDKGISVKEAIDLLSNSASDDQELLYDYVNELEELQRDSIGAVEQQISFVTLFMQYRGEAKLPRSREWQKLDDWTEADTEAIPTKMMEDIFELITWERDGWPSSEGNDSEQEESSPPQSRS